MSPWLVVGCLFVLCHAVLRLSAAYIPNAIPAHQVAVLLSFCGVAAYAWLSGLNPPVVRAAVMAALAVLDLLMSRRTAPLRILFGTFFLTLLLQPLSVLQQGFWLSYAAVAVLCWGVMSYQRQSGSVYTFLRAQVVLFLCMAPLLGVLVGAVPFISIPANIMAVPVVTLVTLPSLLLGLLFSKVSSVVSDWLLAVADISLATVFNMLDWLLSVVPLQMQSFGYFSSVTALVAGVAALVSCLPVSPGLRFVVSIGLLPMLLANTANLPLGEFQLQVLDVGQGSAAILDTRTHRIAVDAGPKFEDRFDAGESIVIPALRNSGADRVDLVLLTHSDNDHAGGRAALVNRYPNAQDIGATRQCVHGHSWVWDEVKFTTLQYFSGANRNDRSCTLLVRNDAQSVYLSGDIGIDAERVLTDQLPRRLSVLIAPHHGSQSSSSSLFTRHTQPDWVIYSAGRFSRYGHPHAVVTERYDLECAQQLVTGALGGITWRSALPNRVFSQRLGLLSLENSPALHQHVESACVKSPKALFAHQG